MKKIIVGALAIALVACGGSDSKGGSGPAANQAQNATFNYPSTPNGSSTDVQNAAAAANQIQAAFAQNGLSSAGAQSAASNMSEVASVMLGSSYGPMATSAAKNVYATARRLSVGQARTMFVDNTCVAETATSVTFNNCTDTYTDTNGTVTTTVNGSFNVPSQGKVNWNVKIVSNETVTGQGGSANITMKLSMSGDATATDTTLVGWFLNSLDITVVGSGYNIVVGVDESLNVDVTHNSNCVTSGTLEAKRVWRARPPVDSGQDANALYPNKGAKVVWSSPDATTGCATKVDVFLSN